MMSKRFRQIAGADRTSRTADRVSYKSERLCSQGSPASEPALATFAMKEESLMPAPALNHLKLKIVDGVAVVDFIESGLMFETALIQDIGQELQSLVTDHGYTRILLDFTHVQYMSSAMLGQL